MKATKIQNTSREADEELLTVLRLATEGVRNVDIAKRTGLTASAVSVLRQRVLSDDLVYSGEKSSVVRAGYVF